MPNGGVGRAWSRICRYLSEAPRRVPYIGQAVPEGRLYIPRMPTRPWILAESTWKTVDATPYVVAILPWGATEAHNYHLPYTTDTIQCDHIAARAAEHAWNAGARVIVLPTVPFGVQTTQIDIK